MRTNSLLPFTLLFSSTVYSKSSQDSHPQQTALMVSRSKRHCNYDGCAPSVCNVCPTCCGPPPIPIAPRDCCSSPRPSPICCSLIANPVPCCSPPPPPPPAPEPIPVPPAVCCKEFPSMQNNCCRIIAMQIPNVQPCCLADPVPANPCCSAPPPPPPTPCACSAPRPVPCRCAPPPVPDCPPPVCSPPPPRCSPISITCRLSYRHRRDAQQAVRTHLRLWVH